MRAALSGRGRPGLKNCQNGIILIRAGNLKNFLGQMTPFEMLESAIV